MQDLERLAEEITTLAAHIHATMARWLGLVAEYDRRGGWAGAGAKSCAHWLSYMCGLSPVAAREHVRVARRLEEMPVLRAAFERGELSYSKVRALTRVEGVEREEDLLDWARCATASELERTVRAYRHVLKVEAGIDEAYEDRYVSWFYDDHGALCLRARLPAEEGAVLIEAIEAVRERLDAERDDSAEAHFDGHQEESEAVTTIIASESASAEAPDDDEPTFELPPMREPARGARRADALVALVDAGVIEQASRSNGDRFQVVVHVDAATLQHGEGDRCEFEDGMPIAAQTMRRVCCDASLVRMVERDGQPLSVGRKTRRIPPALQRALRSRDRGCRFPGCTQTRGVDGHHIEHWADGGETKLHNLVQLCRYHHRLVHEGGYRVGRERGEIVFRRPDGLKLRAVPRARRGECGALLAANGHHGVQPDGDTCIPRHRGWEPFNLADQVDAFISFATPRVQAVTEAEPAVAHME